MRKKLRYLLLLSGTAAVAALLLAFRMPVKIEASYQGKSTYEKEAVKQEDMDVKVLSLTGKELKRVWTMSENEKGEKKVLTVTSGNLKTKVTVPMAMVRSVTAEITPGTSSEKAESGKLHDTINVLPSNWVKAEARYTDGKTLPAEVTSVVQNTGNGITVQTDRGTAEAVYKGTLSAVYDGEIKEGEKLDKGRVTVTRTDPEGKEYILDSFSIPEDARAGEEIKVVTPYGNTELQADVYENVMASYLGTPEDGKEPEADKFMLTVFKEDGSTAFLDSSMEELAVTGTKETEDGQEVTLSTKDYGSLLCTIKKQQAKAEHIIIVGDSRVVQMGAAFGVGSKDEAGAGTGLVTAVVDGKADDVTFIGKGSEGFRWAQSTEERIDEAVKDGKEAYTAIVLWMGTNDRSDAYAVDGYTKILREWKARYPKAEIVFATCGRLGQYNDSVQAFNSAMMENLPKGVKTVDVYNLTITENLPMQDWAHYTPGSYKRILDYIKQNI